jgi:hypothetical protein
MCGSQHDGEAINALRKAQQLCAAHKLTLIEALAAGATARLDLARITALENSAYERGRRDGLAEAKQNGGASVSAQDWARECLAELSDLEAHERSFLDDVVLRARSRFWGTARLTPRQKRWLGQLWGRLQAQRALP